MGYLRAISIALMGMVFVGYIQAGTNARQHIDRLSDAAALLAQSQQSAGIALADEIWNLAELGYLEFQAAPRCKTICSKTVFKSINISGAYLLPLSLAIDPVAQMMPIL